VVAGAHDAVRPPATLRRFADGLRTATFSVVDSAHFIAAEAPSELLHELTAFYAQIGLRDRTDSPRHTDIPAEVLTSDQKAAMAEASGGTRGRIPAPMRAWLASPEFARRAQSVGETLRYHTSLAPRLSELAILVTARFWRSEYEWRVHAAAAAEAGLPEHVLESIRRGLAPRLTAADEQMVFDVSLGMHREHRISDDVFERASAVLGRAGLVELIGILGYYTLVSMTLSVYEIDSPDANGSLFAPAPRREDAHARR
jgi:4-carboxymuconolactone decarboxylase